MTICKKCGYERKPTDDAPDWQCPSCHVAYVKVNNPTPKANQAGPAPQKPARAKPKKERAKPKVEVEETTPLKEKLQDSYQPLKEQLVTAYHRQPHRIHLISVAIVCLVIGYYGGRWHLKHQVASTFQNAAKEFAEGMAGIFSGDSSKPAPRDSSTPKSAIRKSAKIITATLLTKIYEPANVSARKYEDEIEVSIMFENKTKKEIRAFDGVMIFTDLLGNEIIKVNIAVNDPIDAGAKDLWMGSIDYNQFMASHKRLRAASMENIKLGFVLKKVLYAGGDLETFD